MLCRDKWYSSKTFAKTYIIHVMMRRYTDIYMVVFLYLEIH